ncbi:hypothetical protein [Rahnella sp. PCH160]|uniref:hypothetical protein n=1 Tax=Rahnella sp. PCH160 TaxID=3447928 RepID=UPI0039FD3011
MDVNAYFTLKALNQDACVTIDFTKYTYVMSLREASGEQDILHSEPETAFTQDGHSAHHHMTFVNAPTEKPLVYCDIFCQGLCTDKNILINSFPDASTTNNWTVFNKKFSSAETTKNPAFDKICTISNHRIFIDSQFPVGHPNDPFEKSKIERQLRARLEYRALASEYMRFQFPDQRDASLCGPAAFLFSLLKDRPDVYSQFIKDLWNDGIGILGSLKVIPSEGCCHPVNYTRPDASTRLPAIDWISLASLRDNENIFMKYNSPDDTVSGITLPEGIIKWVSAVGAEIIFHEMTLTSWSKNKVLELNKLVEPTNHVAVLVNDGLLSGGESGYPSHWIVLEEKLSLYESNLLVSSETSDSELVDAKLFSWGESKELSKFRLSGPMSFGKYRTYVYGCVVFKKIP